MIEKIKGYFQKVFLKKKQYPVILSTRKGPIGRVLFSYLEAPVIYREDDPRLNGHSNQWESREIAHIFSRLGYTVDAINWGDCAFIPNKQYDIIFDICYNMERLAPHMPPQCLRILHCTGSDPFYQNNAEIERIQALKARRQCEYAPKRTIAHPEQARKSLELADICSLLGSEHTRSTYPEQFRGKIKLVTVSASHWAHSINLLNNPISQRHDYLWFFGSGAVHKGLDLLLEVFKQNPQLQLHVVGDVTSEPDFIKIYDRELTKTRNIVYHGYIKPDTYEFERIIRDVYCFIAPSCSEGISSAAATCLQLGLYPIISRDTGLSLPSGCGIYLEKCTIEEIQQAIDIVQKFRPEELQSQISLSQAYGLQEFSRESFKMKMMDFIMEALDSRGMKYLL